MTISSTKTLDDIYWNIPGCEIIKLKDDIIPRIHVVETGDPNCRHREIIDSERIGRCRCGRVVDYNGVPTYKHRQSNYKGGKSSAETRKRD